MFWLRAIMVSGFSLTAATLLFYQGNEIIHAFMNLFTDK